MTGFILYRAQGSGATECSVCSVRIEANETALLEAGVRNPRLCCCRECFDEMLPRDADVQTLGAFVRERLPQGIALNSSFAGSRATFAVVDVSERGAQTGWTVAQTVELSKPDSLLETLAFLLRAARFHDEQSRIVPLRPIWLASCPRHDVSTGRDDRTPMLLDDAGRERGRVLWLGLKQDDLRLGAYVELSELGSGALVQYAPLSRFAEYRVYAY